jgi:hypothetical protein
MQLATNFLLHARLMLVCCLAYNRFLDVCKNRQIVFSSVKDTLLNAEIQILTVGAHQRC